MVPPVSGEASAEGELAAYHVHCQSLYYGRSCEDEKEADDGAIALD